MKRLYVASVILLATVLVYSISIQDYSGRVEPAFVADDEISRYVYYLGFNRSYYEVTVDNDSFKVAEVYLDTSHRYLYQKLVVEHTKEEKIGSFSIHTGPVESPSKVEVTGYRPKVGRLNDVPVLDKFYPEIYNPYELPAYVAEVRMTLSNETHRYWKMYRPSMKGNAGLIMPGERTYPGESMPYSRWQIGDTDNSTITKLEELEGKTYDLYFEILDGAGNLLGEAVFRHSFIG
ncbi:hypothetical protein JXL21_09055 [Candidatus Bathyarchaeota archaeon]|nr:hypothetical protein [Candidatus Bathyarchaeota archaeon]